MKRIYKKGVIEINQVVPLLVTLLIVAFVIGITVLSQGELIEATGGSVNVSTGIADRAINNTLGATFNLSQQLPLFGTIVGLFIILGIIFLLVRNKVKVT